MSDQINIKDVLINMKNCKICGKITNDDQAICKYCRKEYQTKLYQFLRNNPGITYTEAVFNKNLPVSGEVLYEFCKAKIIKIK